MLADRIRWSIDAFFFLLLITMSTAWPALSCCSKRGKKTKKKDDDEGAAIADVKPIGQLRNTSDTVQKPAIARTTATVPKGSAPVIDNAIDESAKRIRSKTHTEAIGEDMTIEVNTVDPTEGAKQPRRLTDKEFQEKAKRYVQRLRDKEEKAGQQGVIEEEDPVLLEVEGLNVAEVSNRTQKTQDGEKPSRGSTKKANANTLKQSSKKVPISEKTCRDSQKETSQMRGDAKKSEKTAKIQPATSQKTAKIQPPSSQKTAKEARKKEPESSQKTAKEPKSKHKSFSLKNRKKSPHQELSCPEKTQPKSDMNEKSDATQK